MRWTILVIFIMSLTACGQKGDLYLPEKSVKGHLLQDKPAYDRATRELSTGAPFTHTVY